MSEDRLHRVQNHLLQSGADRLHIEMLHRSTGTTWLFINRRWLDPSSEEDLTALHAGMFMACLNVWDLIETIDYVEGVCKHPVMFFRAFKSDQSFLAFCIIRHCIFSFSPQATTTSAPTPPSSRSAARGVPCFRVPSPTRFVIFLPDWILL